MRYGTRTKEEALTIKLEKSKDGKSLQSETGEVSARMVAFLQSKSDIAGAKIISYELADLQYAPEIAPGMLVRQQGRKILLLK